MGWGTDENLLFLKEIQAVNGCWKVGALFLSSTTFGESPLLKRKQKPPNPQATLIKFSGGTPNHTWTLEGIH